MGKSFWMAAGAYLIPTFPLGYFWHLTVFKAHYDRLEMYRDQVIIPFGLLAMFIQAIAFAWIYPRVFSTARADWVAGALKFGVLFGLVAWSLTVLPVAAKYRSTSVAGFLTLETAFTLLQFAIVSPLIALAWRDPA
jgi:hypothetical protein